MQDFTLAVHYLRQIAEQLNASGADVSAWLQRSGLSEAQLDAPDFNLDFPRFSRLIEDALQSSGEAAIGLLVGERLVVNSHGIVGFAALQSGSVRQVIQLLERYFGVRTSLVAISLQEDGELAHLVFTPNYPLGTIQRPVLEAVVLAIKNVFDAVSLGASGVMRVSFPFACPDYVALATEMLRCEVVYDAPWTGFTLPLALLDQPLKMADPASFRDAEQICQRELDKLEQAVSMSSRVRRIMLEKHNGFPSLNVTARLFHLTPRTLHRRLLEEGTSFKEILEQVRHTLAVEYLKAGHLSIEEIAYTLGYTDMANFRRAFKRWESMPPSRYRADPPSV
ncbi:TPA: AraC family transcriptional regulator [Pseudomonas aeruginosa]|nr:AraC family transcriptional regulator [Pseudomonas aeruginosa]EKU4832184.1 AraC family transcriptional regulator [Pseudomonas aeruginosa]EKW2948372.1 AraC family transcriptional regulator [Pseudomonas aeruginosa]HCF2613273.1 AraC family transcriptional regulator [Pseudomonas aeruginosa]HEJ1871012.1 AraC family transcriptional regulator [Pseudomonas aeruginosa]